MAEELKALFESRGHAIAPGSRVPSLAAEVCSGLELEPIDLLNKWEAYAMNQSIDAPSEADFLSFRKTVEKSVERERMQPRATKSTIAAMEMRAAGIKRVGTSVLAAPTIAKQQRVSALPQMDKKSESSQPESSQASVAFASRKNAGEIASTYNSALTAEYERSVSVTARTRVRVVAGVSPHTKYMWECPKTRAASLVERIRFMAPIIGGAHHIEKFAPLVTPTSGQDPVCVIGRVCCDSDDSNASKFELEDHRGRRVNLDLSRVTASYSLFQGQVVGVEGFNPTGRCVVARRILESPPLPPPTTVSSQMSTMWQTMGGAMGVVIAAGPYTLGDNTEFAPLAALLSWCETRSPHVVILIGPFVDSDHTSLAPTCPEPADPIELMGKVSRMIEAYMQSHSATRFVIIPHIKDACAQCVFPQPPMSWETMGMKPNTDHVLASNPSMFSVNEVMVGAVTSDVMYDLSKSVTSHPPPTDRLARLSQLLLQQRSFYPVYPPAEGSQMSLSHPENLSIANHSPDILILPTMLTTFAKQVESTLVINPGRVCKAQSGGTFACVTIHPYLGVADAAPVEHKIPSRTRVDIIRV